MVEEVEGVKKQANFYSFNPLQLHSTTFNPPLQIDPE
jgi:hypothetical protein